MSPGVLAAVIVLVMLPVDLIVAAVVVRAAWEAGPRFPGREIAPGAVRRNFQSFKYGIYNLGMCVHVAVDEEHLHLLPSRMLRLVGAKPISVPWEEIELVKKKRRTAEVRIAGRKVLGPAWALGLAGSARDGEERQRRK